VKLALGTVGTIFSLLLAAATGIGLWVWWTDCHPSPVGFGAPLLREWCSSLLRESLGAVGLTVLTGMAAYLVIRYRDRGWIRRVKLS
jgi:hypothetical protein